MSPEERAVIRLALRWHGGTGGPNTEARLHHAIQALKISRQPEHTVEPIPCGVYANHSATMFCVLPKGHEGSVPKNDRYQGSTHAGYPGGVRGTGPNGGMRRFDHWPYYETMGTHERAACARFPGCTRHPER